MSDFISFLFKTNALNICPENSPFWYTSGKIGPYYINAEFYMVANKILKIYWNLLIKKRKMN